MDEPRDDLDLIDPVADPLGAAVHRLHREADRRHAEQRRAAQAAAAASRPLPAPPPAAPPQPPQPPPAADTSADGDPAAGDPAADEQTEAQLELEARFAEEFVQLPPEIQARLLTFSQDDMNRLFVELTRIELERLQHEAEQAARQDENKGAGWPGGP